MYKVIVTNTHNLNKKQVILNTSCKELAKEMAENLNLAFKNLEYKTFWVYVKDTINGQIYEEG